MRVSRRDMAVVFLVLTLILAMAAALRLYDLGGQSLWSDEGNSAVMAGRSFRQITRDAAADIHPPLYYWLLSLWSRVFGTSEAGLRSLSAVLGTLLVLITARLGRRMYDEGTGLVVAFIAALAPFQVYYSQEARMYILLALAATASMLAFWETWAVERSPARPATESAASSATLVKGNDSRTSTGMVLLPLIWVIGLYTHYFFPLVIALQSLLYALWLWSSRSHGQVVKRALRWMGLLAVAALCYAPWLPVALRQLSAWPQLGARVDLTTALTGSLRFLALGPTGNLDNRHWIVLVLVSFAVLGCIPWRIRGRAAQWHEYVLPAAWVLAPLASIVLLGLYRDAYLKFLLVASPAFTILQARGITGTAAAIGSPRAEPDGDQGSGVIQSRMRQAAWIVAGLATVGLLLPITLRQYFTDPRAARDDYRGIAEFVVATGQEGDAILLTAPGQLEVFRYYYGGELPVYALPRQRPATEAATDADLELLALHEKVYAVYWATAEADPNNLIQNWMDARGYKTLDGWRGNVRLVVYVMPEQREPDEMADALDYRFSDRITLAGYRGWNLSPKAGEVTQLQLAWRADGQLMRRYKIFVQLLDNRDQIIAQRDAEPVGESRPTNSWDPGETIIDNHGLLIPPGTPPGVYRRILGVYDLETGERLRLSDGSDNVALPPIAVVRATNPVPLAALGMQYTQRFDFGGIDLLGHNRYKRGYAHDPTAPLLPGDLLHLTFFWQANIQPRAPWWFGLSLNDSSGHVVAHLEAPLVGESYSTQLWEAGEIVRGEHDLLLPADLPAGSYRLTLELLPDTGTPAGLAYLGEVIVGEPTR